MRFARRRKNATSRSACGGPRYDGSSKGGERAMERKSNGESERQRVPQPLIKRRIASGRGAMEQPNVTHDGEAALTPAFWLAVLITGVATGLFGDFLMWILKLAEHGAFNYHSGSFQDAVAAVGGPRRIGSLLVAGVIGALSWYLIRRYLKNEKSEIDEAVWNGDGDLSLRRSLFTSIVSEVVI